MFGPPSANDPAAAMTRFPKHRAPMRRAPAPRRTGRSLPATLLACACMAAMSAACAGEVQALPPGEAPDCPAEVAAARADAQDKRGDAAGQAARPAPAPPRAKPSVRAADAASPGRLQAPRWHSFLPGMFR